MKKREIALAICILLVIALIIYVGINDNDQRKTIDFLVINKTSKYLNVSFNYCEFHNNNNFGRCNANSPNCYALDCYKQYDAKPTCFKIKTNSEFYYDSFNFDVIERC